MLPLSPFHFTAMRIYRDLSCHAYHPLLRVTVTASILIESWVTLSIFHCWCRDSGKVVNSLQPNFPLLLEQQQAGWVSVYWVGNDGHTSRWLASGKT